jgi:hypothetical protein
MRKGTPTTCFAGIGLKRESNGHDTMGSQLSNLAGLRQRLLTKPTEAIPSACGTPLMVEGKFSDQKQ